jgi:hypothetical protein
MLSLEYRMSEQKIPDMDQVIDSSLEAYIQSFKVKYVRLQSVHEDKARAADKRIRELETENDVLGKQVQRLAAQTRDAEDARARAEQSAAHVREQYGAREQQLAGKLDKVTQLLAAKDRQHQAHLETCAAETQRLRADAPKQREEAAELRRELDAQTERLKAQEEANKALQTRAIELQSGMDAKVATLATYEAEIARLQSEARQRDANAAAQVCGWRAGW